MRIYKNYWEYAREMLPKVLLIVAVFVFAMIYFYANRGVELSRIETAVQFYGIE
jgi:hypothetical protein